MTELVFRGGTIVTVDPQSRILSGDVASQNGKIVQVGGDYTPTERDYQVINCEGCVVMPGLVQSHVHMCQSLARGRADDLALLDWLKRVVWPYEGALTEQDMTAAAELACVELLLGGTTAILDMGSVHHTDQLFEVAQRAGLRATIGKAMMDESDADIPRGLRENTADSLRESARLANTWHGAAGNRLRYAYAPRFALSCTEQLLRETSQAARARGLRIHTHASENQDEIAEVKRRTSRDNIVYLHDVGLTGPDVALAHCIWVNELERELLRDTNTHVLHCPSSNLKLGSGIAPIPELLANGVSVSLGADGCPCNNNLDGFLEMRLAALIHKPRTGSHTMPAAHVVRLATMGGAAALGLVDDIGSLEVGKRGDIIAVDTRGPHVVPTSSPLSSVVYACNSRDVKHVAIDGELVVRDRELLTLDTGAISVRAQKRATSLFARL